jgi:glycosyltransferase involved in cell wall biosynthesis
MPDQKTIPVSAVIPTKDRAEVLGRTLRSLSQQNRLPREIIVIDASSSNETELELERIALPSVVTIVYAKAAVMGAAHQRMQGIQMATTDFIFFIDDDIILEEHCVERLFNGFNQQEKVGGVNAMITNQRYTTPGFVTRTMYIMLSEKWLNTWAGKVIGPAWNLLPEDDPRLPDYVECEWLNTTCTMYRKQALPTPVFPDVFKGYSLLEDAALSIVVSRSWTLLNARTARIFHDSQPGSHKKDIAFIAEMDVVNRHYVMRHILGRKGFKNYFKLFLYAMFGTVAGAISSRRGNVAIADLKGKIRGLKHILRERTGGNRI